MQKTAEKLLSELTLDEKLAQLVAHGSPSDFVIDKHFNTELAADPNSDSDFTTPKELDVNINSHNVSQEIKVFIEALQSGGKMPVSSMEGASTIAVACATVESAKIGAPVKIKYPKI